MKENQSHRFVLWSLIIVFLLLVLRLFQLQIIKGKENRFLAENNRVRKLVLPAQRGIFFDRHGEALVKNQPVFQIKENGENKTISRDQALLRQEQGKPVEISTKRNYPDGDLFAHLLGFLGEVSLTELKEEKFELKGYFLGSLIGQSGAEMEYESKLKGKDGSELVEVNTAGEAIRSMNRVLPQSGKNLTLAVDKNLQIIAAEQMQGKKGAVIASNPKTGEILLYYSSPSFDPNLFLDKNKSEQLQKVINDEEKHPLLDRVISGIFAPGSTFKIVTSIAGLQEGMITGSSLINDPGVIEVNQFKFSNWYFTQYGRTEGEINVIKALARSTDTFFYLLGEKIGEEKLISWARKFHLDQRFGIDLPGEIPGFIATPQWKQRTRGERWFLGNTYHLAIGQGDISLTPLGVNQMTSVVASGGKICQPRILRINAENTSYKEECIDLEIKPENLQIVKKGMIDACATGGTAYPFFDFEPQVACKTGTAETSDAKYTHAWFTVFAPVNNPQIVLTVLVENGGEGSTVAAPIAKEILKEFFKEYGL